MKLRKQKLIIFLVLAIVFLIVYFSADAQDCPKRKVKIEDFMPSDELENGFVPDESTAIRVAEVILEPIYGKEMIDLQRPLKAELLDSNIWWVHGTLPEFSIGGVTEILISKSDCKIIGVSHGK